MQLNHDRVEEAPGNAEQKVDRDRHADGLAGDLSRFRTLRNWLKVTNRMNSSQLVVPARSSVRLCTKIIAIRSAAARLARTQPMIRRLLPWASRRALSPTNSSTLML